METTASGCHDDNSRQGRPGLRRSVSAPVLASPSRALLRRCHSAGSVTSVTDERKVTSITFVLDSALAAVTGVAWCQCLPSTIATALEDATEHDSTTCSTHPSTIKAIVFSFFHASIGVVGLGLVALGVVWWYHNGATRRKDTENNLSFFRRHYSPAVVVLLLGGLCQAMASIQEKLLASLWRHFGRSARHEGGGAYSSGVVLTSLVFAVVMLGLHVYASMHVRRRIESQDGSEKIALRLLAESLSSGAGWGFFNITDVALEYIGQHYALSTLEVQLPRLVLCIVVSSLLYLVYVPWLLRNEDQHVNTDKRWGASRKLWCELIEQVCCIVSALALVSAYFEPLISPAYSDVYQSYIHKYMYGSRSMFIACTGCSVAAVITVLSTAFIHYSPYDSASPLSRFIRGGLGWLVLLAWWYPIELVIILVRGTPAAVVALIITISAGVLAAMLLWMAEDALQSEEGVQAYMTSSWLVDLAPSVAQSALLSPKRIYQSESETETEETVQGGGSDTPTSITCPVDTKDSKVCDTSHAPFSSTCACIIQESIQDCEVLDGKQDTLEVFKTGNASKSCVCVAGNVAVLHEEKASLYHVPGAVDVRETIETFLKRRVTAH